MRYVLAWMNASRLDSYLWCRLGFALPCTGRPLPPTPPAWRVRSGSLLRYWSHVAYVAYGYKLRSCFFVDYAYGYFIALVFPFPP